jgi:hypothetical protein
MLNLQDMPRRKEIHNVIAQAVKESLGKTYEANAAAILTALDKYDAENRVILDRGLHKIIYDTLCKTNGDLLTTAVLSSMAEQVITDLMLAGWVLSPYEDAPTKSSEALMVLARRVHKVNAKWWVDINTGEPKERNVGEMLMLLVSEAAEAMEGHRKSKMDDHLPQYPMYQVEMVDIVVRWLDMVGSEQIGFDATEVFEAKMAYNAIRQDHQLESRRKVDGKKY